VSGKEIRSVLVLSPESPYPLHGGGQYRTASLVHYFSRFADVDLVLISESGKPALLPPGLVRSQKMIPLPPHGKGLVERYLRNARRAIRGVPPLIDRLSGLGKEITDAIGSTRYDLGVIEHFWLAPYVGQMEAACDEVALDLHNVESVLHDRCAKASQGFIAAGHRRFAMATQALEAELLPRFSRILATSDTDRAAAQRIAPTARIWRYPNALPETLSRSGVKVQPGLVVFSGNFEYHPNIDAVRFLVSEIWPRALAQCPGLRLRLVGRGDGYIRKLLPEGAGIEVTGPVLDSWQEIAAAQLVIAPLRAGSGTRIKILEGWSAGRPVLATPLAAEGLETVDGGNIVLASDANIFAARLVSLMGDANTAERLGAEGLATFRRYYTWEAAWQTLDLELRPESASDTVCTA
jgi:glycosyltransferase involved in cell wall biosynthesis